MIFVVEDYIESLENRIQKLMEGLCARGRSELEYEFERGKIAELKQQLSYLKQYTN